MSPDPVEEDLDVLEEARPGLLSRREDLAASQLLLQAREEALHRRVIPAIAPPAHAAHDPVTAQEPLVMLAGILAAPVGMRNETRRRQTPRDGHLQGVDDQPAV